ncbi:zinc finger CCCH domain-containing protein 2-like protein [Carex littledalei]|uniref:Zinc finger CCCH domain-containing protein 2-like protein n=1 Tax=Carex littledalei TaxID=544730 RepID=A0A833RG47_9POAL|nr:zinc finger CCCH domain-containing protein 2-like protein [Carex littledalei]
MIFPNKTRENYYCPTWSTNKPIATDLYCPCCNHSFQPDLNPLPESMNSTDEFRMYRFKVQRCSSTRTSHDWTDCPYLHPGEKARRRDPRKFRYTSELCTEFRKNGKCAIRDECRFAHGVFEVWLHPDRYRTQLCRDGTACTRKVCFFAHTAGQLRWPGDGKSDWTSESDRDAAHLPILPSLLSAIVTDMRRTSATGIGKTRTFCGIETPDIKWVSDLVDF